MFEDTNANGALDNGDQQITVYYDESVRDSKACYGTLNADQTCSGTYKNVRDVKYLWSASQWLNSIADADILEFRFPGALEPDRTCFIPRDASYQVVSLAVGGGR